MAFDEIAIRADEVSELLKQQVLDYKREVDIYETGTALQVGDGIARVQGLSNVMANELVEFPNDVVGMVLNLEEDNVGCILFGDDQLIKEGIRSSGRDGSSSAPWATACWAAWWTPWAARSTARDLSSARSPARSRRRPPAWCSASP